MGEGHTDGRKEIMRYASVSRAMMLPQAIRAVVGRRSSFSGQRTSPQFLNGLVCW